MALVKATLKTAIKEAFDSVSDVDINCAQGREKIADKLATAIDAYIKSGTVNVAVTVAVTTAGSPTAQAGGGTGTGTGTIS